MQYGDWDINWRFLPMIKKLRVKFVIINMTIVTIVLSILLGFIVISTRNDIRSSSINMMRNLSMEPRKPGVPDDSGNDDVRLPFFTLRYDENGELDAFGGYYDLTDTEQLEKIYEAADSAGTDQGILKEYKLRFVKNQTPRGEIIVFADTSSEDTTVAGIVRTSVLIGIAAEVAFLVISILLARWAVKPVEQAWTQQRQFIADASHDLKTPLTVILTDAEMLQSDSCSDDMRMKLSSAIFKMATQMKGLVASMLDLTKVDVESDNLMLTDVDLSKVVNDAVMHFEPAFYEKGLSIKNEIQSGIKIKGNEQELNNLVSVLLDNAGKYCYAGTETIVRLSKQPSGIVLSVSDEGDEIPKDDRENIFKRFYRADKARSMNQSYGLGLSIAAKIVENHKGKIWCESCDGVNTFYVRF